MTSRTAPSRALQSACRQQSTCFRCQWSVRRKASTLTNETDASEDVIPDSSLLAPQPDQEIVTSWDPVQRSRARRRQLPSSRYDRFRIKRPLIYPTDTQSDTNTVPHDTTAAPSTHINHHLPHPPTLASSSLAPFPSPASNKPTPAP